MSSGALPLEVLGRASTDSIDGDLDVPPQPTSHARTIAGMNNWTLQERGMIAFSGLILGSFLGHVQDIQGFAAHTLRISKALDGSPQTRAHSVFMLGSHSHQHIVIPSSESMHARRVQPSTSRYLGIEARV